MGGFPNSQDLLGRSEDARGTTGRNMQTGKKVPNAQHGSWLGALG